MLNNVNKNLGYLINLGIVTMITTFYTVIVITLIMVKVHKIIYLIKVQ